MGKMLRSVAVVIAVVTLVSQVYGSATFNVRALTNGDPLVAAMGEQSIVVDVSQPDLASQQTLFTFNVSGSTDFFIDGVYFYDGVLMDYPSLSNASEVGFSEGVSAQLPGIDLSGHKLVTGYLHSDDASPSQEPLGVLFNLLTDATYADVLAGINSGTIIIGIKGNVGDDSALFTVVPAVPVPGALLLSSIGVGCFGLFRRRVAA